jgi:hypothetical protein
MASLAEIYKKEKKSGGTLGTAIGKSFREKIDPRQLINQTGILPLLFPSLKAYKAIPEKTVKTPKETTSQTLMQQSVDAAPSKEMIASTMMVAKNTMGLPLMARDINLMKTNIAKMTKALGESPEYKKTDMFWKASKAREELFESSLSKMSKKVGDQSGKSNLTKSLSFLTGKKERDGRSKETALFVETVGLDVSGAAGAAAGAAAGGAGAAGAAGGALAKVKAALPFIGSALLPLVGLSGLVYLFYKMFDSKGAFLDEGSDAVKGLKQAEKVGGLAGVKDEEEKRKSIGPEEKAYLEVTDLEKYTEDGVVNNAMLKDISKKSPEHAKAVQKYRQEKNIPEEITTQTSASIPSTPSPTPVSTEEKIPSNVVRSTSGEPVRSGSGGYVTSGEESTSPSAVKPTTSQTTPSAVPSSAQIPSASGLPIDYKAYADKVGEKESGGNYKAVNTLGYLGKYQFGAMALQDMGLVKKGTSLKGLDDPSNWTIEGGKQAFLNNPQLQEDTMLRYTKQNFATLNRIGVVNKDSKPQEVAGYLAASHLLGPGGAKQLSQGKAGTDAYGTSSATYFKVGSATQAPTSVASAAAPTPTTGSTISSASTNVADGQRASMTPTTSGSTVIDNSTKTTVAAAPKQRSNESTYDTDLIRSMVSMA